MKTSESSSSVFMLNSSPPSFDSAPFCQCRCHQPNDTDSTEATTKSSRPKPNLAKSNPINIHPSKRSQRLRTHLFDSESVIDENIVFDSTPAREKSVSGSCDCHSRFKVAMLPVNGSYTVNGSSPDAVNQMDSPCFHIDPCIDFYLNKREITYRNQHQHQQKINYRTAYLHHESPILGTTVSTVTQSNTNSYVNLKYEPLKSDEETNISLSPNRSREEFAKKQRIFGCNEDKWSLELVKPTDIDPKIKETKLWADDDILDDLNEISSGRKPTSPSSPPPSTPKMVKTLILPLPLIYTNDTSERKSSTSSSQSSSASYSDYSNCSMNNLQQPVKPMNGHRTNLSTSTSNVPPSTTGVTSHVGYLDKADDSIRIRKHIQNSLHRRHNSSCNLPSNGSLTATNTPAEANSLTPSSSHTCCHHHYCHHHGHSSPRLSVSNQSSRTAVGESTQKNQFLTIPSNTNNWLSPDTNPREEMLDVQLCNQQQCRNATRSLCQSRSASIVQSPSTFLNTAALLRSFVKARDQADSSDTPKRSQNEIKIMDEKGILLVVDDDGDDNEGGPNPPEQRRRPLDNSKLSLIIQSCMDAPSSAKFLSPVFASPHENHNDELLLPSASNQKSFRSNSCNYYFDENSVEQHPSSSLSVNQSLYRKASMQEPGRMALMMLNNRNFPDSASSMSLTCCSRCCFHQPMMSNSSTNLESSNATSGDLSATESLPDIGYFKTHLIETSIQSAPARTGEVLLKNFDRNFNNKTNINHEHQDCQLARPQSTHIIKSGSGSMMVDEKEYPSKTASGKTSKVVKFEAASLVSDSDSSGVPNNENGPAAEQTPLSLCRRLFRQRKIQQPSMSSVVIGGGKSSPTETSCVDVVVSAKNSVVSNTTTSTNWFRTKKQNSASTSALDALAKKKPTNSSSSSLSRMRKIKSKELIVSQNSTTTGTTTSTSPPSTQSPSKTSSSADATTTTTTTTTTNPRTLRLFDFYSYYNNKFNQENRLKQTPAGKHHHQPHRHNRNRFFFTKRNTPHQLIASLTVPSSVEEPPSTILSDRVDLETQLAAELDRPTNSNMILIASNIARDIKSKASNLLRRRHTDASFTEKSLLPSREEVYKWQTSFENLLRHKYGIALFRGFLKTEFSDENIEFWLECEDYKYTNKEIKRQAKSKKIYSDFVAIGSPREVNLDIEIRAHTAHNILNPTPDTFERAQKRIQALMEKDSYPRFLESDLYKNLLASAYPPSSASPGGAIAALSSTSSSTGDLKKKSSISESTSDVSTKTGN